MFGFGKKRLRGARHGPQARTVALFSSKENDIRQWRTEGKSWLWIANEIGVSPATAIAGVRRLGIETTWLSHALSPNAIERTNCIVAARERGDTLKQIGAREGITRERVRQILVKAGKHEIPWSRSRVSEFIRACPECGTKFGGEWTPTEAARRTYCSRLCSIRARRKPSLKIALRNLEALQFRRQGKTWAEVASKFNLPKTGGQNTIRIFAKRFGLDIFWAEGRAWVVQDPGDDWFTNAHTVIEKICRRT